MAANATAFPARGGLRRRVFAWGLARYGKKLERHLESRKSRLFAGISGTVLEIGAGTGANLRYLAKERVRWIGMEPNPFMNPYLAKEAAAAGIEIELRPGIAESLPVPDNSVDAVVSTLVLCCVSDQQQAISEVLRVLRPGGRFLFLEHVAAPRGTWLRRFQSWVKPVWRQLGDGCQPDRETWVALERAGFGKLSYEKFRVPVPVASPHICGIAVKM